MAAPQRGFSGGEDRIQGFARGIAACSPPSLRRDRCDRILVEMAKEPERLDPQDRAREKQQSREDDARALASGEKSAEQLRRENGHFAFPKVRVSLREATALE